MGQSTTAAEYGVVDFEPYERKIVMDMMRRIVRGSTVGALLALAATAPAAAAATGALAALDSYISGSAPPSFESAEKGVDAMKSALSSNNFDAFASLLGLDPAKLKGNEDVMTTYDLIREGAARKVYIQKAGDRDIIEIGEILWPLPFPLVKSGDGKWSFDPHAGVEEIVNRRIGENELNAIATMRAYVWAQAEYASEDHDGDGVLEYAQKLISSPGKEDGLYWPPDQGSGESVAGAALDQAVITKAKAGGGYFGYYFKILKGQGPNVAGGGYSYVINGNMIAGFALVAWPVKYGETGVDTFLVNQAGIVYQADLGENTSKLARGMVRFNPGKNWTIVND